MANGSGIAGVAGKTTTFLKTKGIDTLPPVDAAKTDYPETVVYFAEGYQAQATAVAQQLGGVQVAGLVPDPAARRRPRGRQRARGRRQEADPRRHQLAVASEPAAAIRSRCGPSR